MGMSTPDSDLRPLQNEGKLIWCSKPPLDTGKLRKWMEEAGVHLYAPEGFSVHASRELVSITSSSSVNATLKWPEKVAVNDMYDGWSGSGVEFSCPFKAGQTRLFRVRVR
jgi:hypothetical protein